MKKHILFDKFFSHSLMACILVVRFRCSWLLLQWLLLLQKLHWMLESFFFGSSYAVTAVHMLLLQKLQLLSNVGSAAVHSSCYCRNCKLFFVSVTAKTATKITYLVLKTCGLCWLEEGLETWFGWLIWASNFSCWLMLWYGEMMNRWAEYFWITVTDVNWAYNVVTDVDWAYNVEVK